MVFDLSRNARILDFYTPDEGWLRLTAAAYKKVSAIRQRLSTFFAVEVKIVPDKQIDQKKPHSDELKEPHPTFLVLNFLARRAFCAKRGKEAFTAAWFDKILDRLKPAGARKRRAATAQKPAVKKSTRVAAGKKK